MAKHLMVSCCVGEGDTMEDWDQEQLEKVVNQKHAAEVKNATEIVCSLVFAFVSTIHVLFAYSDL